MVPFLRLFWSNRKQLSLGPGFRLASHLLGLGSGLLLLDTPSSAGGGAGAHLLQLIVLLDSRSAVQVLVELDDLRIDGFKLGLVDVVAGGGAEAVGAAARVGGVVLVVFELRESVLAPVGE